MAQPTIRIEHDGFPDGVLINHADFDPAKHRRFGVSAQQAPAAGGGDPKPEAKDSNGGTGDGPPVSGAPRGRSKKGGR